MKSPISLFLEMSFTNEFVMYKQFTCQEGKVRRTGDGEVRRCDIHGFDSILGHLV